MKTQKELQPRPGDCCSPDAARCRVFPYKKNACNFYTRNDPANLGSILGSSLLGYTVLKRDMFLVLVVHITNFSLNVFQNPLDCGLSCFWIFTHPLQNYFFLLLLLKVALMVNQMHRAKGKGYLKWTPHVPNLPTAALTTPQKV